MILRPVRPASPCGPPITKRPVGLIDVYKRQEVALPGGCAIGSRPIDLHLKGFRAMGAEIDIHHGLVAAKADRLCGTHIYMDKVSVGATINIMMAAAMAEGKTIIELSLIHI